MTYLVILRIFSNSTGNMAFDYVFQHIVKLHRIVTIIRNQLYNRIIVGERQSDFREFLKEIEKCGLDPVCMANTFIKHNSGFKVYTEYCTNYPR